MNNVAAYKGKVITLGTPTSTVILVEIATGNRAEAEAVTEKLIEKGITYVGCEFEIVMHQSPDGKVSGEIRQPLPEFNDDGASI